MYKALGCQCYYVVEMIKRNRNKRKKTSSNTSPSSQHKSKKRVIEDMSQGQGSTPASIPTPVMQMPGENASVSDWGKFIHSEITRMNSELKESIEKNSTDIKDSSKVVSKITGSVGKLIQENQYLKDQNVQLNEKILKLEYHTRRNNLVFDGIAESENENCLTKLRDVLKNLFEDDIEGEMTSHDKACEMIVNRIHRQGKQQIRGRPRQIIVNFQYFGDVDYILSHRKDLPDGVYVNVNYPPEIEQRRSILRPILKQALAIPKYRGKVSLRYDKLVIYGKEYSLGNLKDLPADLKPEATCEVSNTDNIGYLGIHTPLSNFYQSSFKCNGVSYSCVEQAIQADKASSCDDDRMKCKIMNAKDPRDMKHFGSKLMNYNSQRWERERARKVAYNASMSKYSQNPRLRDYLLSTGNKLIFEASPDTVWGCGLHLKNANVLEKDQWPNPEGGLMSSVLMQIREELKSKGKAQTSVT